jgi:biotin carboxylase
MIETHTRMGGGSIHVLTERTTGVDLADVMVGMAFGEEPQVRPQRTGRAAAIRFKKCGRDGRVAQAQIPPIEPGGLIESARIYFQPGEQVTSRSSSLDRLGQVIAVGPEAENVGLAAERFLDRIHVSIEEGAPWTAPAA